MQGKNRLLLRHAVVSFLVALVVASVGSAQTKAPAPSTAPAPSPAVRSKPAASRPFAPPVVNPASVKVNGRKQVFIRADSVVCTASARSPRPIARYSFTLDGNAPVVVPRGSAVFKPIADGKHRITVTAANDTGPASAPVEIAFVVDRQAPRLTRDMIVVAGGKRVVNTREVDIAVRTPSDSGGSGLAAVYLSLNNERGKAVTAPLSVTLPREGTNRIALWAEDSAGNSSTPVETEIILDTRRPTVLSFTADRNGLWGPGAASAKCVFSKPMDTNTPAVAMLDSVKLDCRWAGAETLLVTGTIAKKAANGRRLLGIQGVRDPAGNTVAGEVSIPVTVDTWPPEIDSTMIVLGGGGDAIGADSVECRVDRAQDESGIVRYHFRLDGGAIESTDKPARMLRKLSQGAHRLGVKLEDGAGNTGNAAVKNFRVDSRKPHLASVTADPAPAVEGRVQFQFAFDKGMDARANVTARLGEEKLSGGVWKDTLRYAADLSLSERIRADTLPLALRGFTDRAGNVCADTTIPTAIPAGAFMAWAKTCKTKGDLKEAAAMVRAVLARYPQRADALELLAEICRARKDAAGEEEALDELLTLRPQDVAAAKRLCELANARKDFQAAKRYLTRMLLAGGKLDAVTFDDYRTAKRPFFYVLPGGFAMAGQSVETELLMRNGIDLASQGDLEAAATQFAAAKGIDPALHAAGYNLATIRLMQGKLDEALKIFDKLPADDPALVGNRAAALARKGRFDAAADLYTANPGLLEDPVQENNYGVVLARKEKAGEALPRLQHAASRLNLPQAGINVAFALYVAGDAKEALRAFERLPDTTAERYPDVYYGRALALQKLGKDAEVMTYLRKALSVKPYYVDAMARLGDLQIGSGSSEAARQTLEQVTRVDPSNGDAKRVLSGIYRREGKAGVADSLSLAAAKSIPAKDPNAMAVAIVRFSNATGDSAMNWISLAVSEALTTEMQELSPYRMVERIRIEDVAKNLAMAQAYGDDDALKVGKQLGAGGIVAGSFQALSGSIRLDARLIDAQTGKILFAGTSSGLLGDLPRLERDLALSLAGLGGRQEYAEVSSGPSLEAQKKLAEAKGALYAGDTKASKALFAEAFKIDPRAFSSAQGSALAPDSSATGSMLAILPFANISGESADAWLAEGIPEALTTDLKKSAGLSMVERSQVKKIMEEMSLGQTGLVDEKTAPQVGKLLAAGFAITGGYQTSGGDIRITARLVNTETGAVCLAEDVEGRKADILKLEKALAVKIAAALKKPAAASATAQPEATATGDTAASAESEEAEADTGEEFVYEESRNVAGKLMVLTSGIATTVTLALGAVFVVSSVAHSVNPDGDSPEGGPMVLSAMVTTVAWGATIVHGIIHRIVEHGRERRARNAWEEQRAQSGK